MKKLEIKWELLALGAFIFFAFKPGEVDDSTKIKTINVTGSAEMAVKPDQIKLQVRLYVERDKKDTKEKEFFKILEKHGIKKEDVEIFGLNGHQGPYWRWWYYYYEYWYYSSSYYQTYTIPINNEVDPQKLLSDLKKPLIYSVAIVNGEVSNITEYRKKVKIEAIKAAKEKAQYLLGALGEQIGTVINIQEISPSLQQNYRGWDPYWGYSYSYPSHNLSASSSNTIVNSGQQNNQNGIQHVASDKLKYEVSVTFQIK